MGAATVAAGAEGAKKKVKGGGDKATQIQKKGKGMIGKKGGGEGAEGGKGSKGKKKRKKKSKMDRNKEQMDAEMKEKSAKYTRGDGNSVAAIKDKKLKMQLARSEKAVQDAQLKAAQAEILLPSEAGMLEAEGMEKTQRFTQVALKDAVDVASAKKVFTLRLEALGPYSARYSRNGRHLLMGGKLGHLAVCDWQKGTVTCEVQVKETVRDVAFLHNETMFAAAQRKYVYVYDNTGLEVHCMRSHIEVNRMAYLPYHYLLATVGNAGYLKYQDTSTGKLVAEIRTRLGRCDTMCLNPNNAVCLLGHSNGTVTLWTPSVTTPLVKMLCHKGPVTSIAADRGGRYMATAGMDGQMSVWDLRTYKRVHSYYTPVPATSLDISQRGLLAVGYGSKTEVWADALATKASKPYMAHHSPGCSLQTIEFCPYEDVLGLGHSKGFSSIVVPGAGEPNFDSYEANPFETKKQRREGEVHKLLEKLQPEMITEDPTFVGKVDVAPAEVIAEERRIAAEASMSNSRKKKEKRHMRGRDKIGRKLKKKQGNIVEERKGDARGHNKERFALGEEGEGEAKPVGVLDRFKFKDT